MSVIHGICKQFVQGLERQDKITKGNNFVSSPLQRDYLSATCRLPELEKTFELRVSG